MGILAKTSVAGQALPSALRGKLERAFGADLAGVRVHESALPSEVGASALCCGEHLLFAPGAYDPGGHAGAHRIAHEVVHVLQQRAGRARGEGLVVDPWLEAEAEALAERALRGLAAPVPGAALRPPTLEPRVAQPYDIVLNGNLAAADVDLNNVTFPGQENGLAVGKTNAETFLLDNGQVYLVNTGHGAVNLRLSDDGKMAIEDTNVANRQVKTFFASSSVISASNSALRACGSAYRLRKAAGGTVYMEIGPQATGPFACFGVGGPRRLYQVEVTSAANGAVVTTVAANCNQVADAVMGEARDTHRTVKLAPGAPYYGQFPRWTIGGWAPGPHAAQGDVPLRMAAFIKTYLFNNHGHAQDRVAAMTAATTDYTQGIQAALAGLLLPAQQMAAMVAYCGAIGNDYGRIARRARAGQALNLNGVARGGGVLRGAYNNLIHGVGINAYADAHIGEAYQTYSCGGAERYNDANGRPWLRMHDESLPVPGYVAPVWEYHWGGVIAQSGQDRITFENYARNYEDRDAPQPAAQEARGYFQMTRVPTAVGDAKLAQSWHESCYSVGFANAMTLSMARISRCGR